MATKTKTRTRKAAPHGRTITFESTAIKQIVSTYKAGTGADDLAEAFGVSRGTILRLLRDNKVKIRGRGRPAKG